MTSIRTSVAHGKLVFCLSLLLVSQRAAGQVSAIYPQQKGAVNDYAGKLADGEISELTDLIQQYEQRTSIQFVVVVTRDLQGESARQYAIELGNLWRVGQPERNNGVVLLWAPNERAYSLRLADGLNPDMSDSDAASITRQYLLPYFKRGQYYAGLRETVLATMRHLGDQTWEDRIALRAQASRPSEPQKPQQQSKENEAYKRLLLMVALLLVVLPLAAVAIYKWRRRRQRLAEMDQAKTVILDNLAKAGENIPRIYQLLDDFAKEVPEQDISALRTNAAEQPASILKIKAEARALNFNDLNAYDWAIEVRTQAEDEADRLETVQEQIAAIRSAKERSRTRIQGMSTETFRISDLRDSSRRDEVDKMLLQSQRDYEEARQNSSLSLVDWLIIDDLLTRSDERVQQARIISQTEQYTAAPSFGQGPDSSVDSSPATFDTSMSGGAGFDGGSGSDGSY